MPMIDVILNFFNDDFNTSKKSIESKFNRILNIGERELKLALKPLY